MRTRGASDSQHQKRNGRLLSSAEATVVATCSKTRNGGKGRNKNIFKIKERRGYPMRNVAIANLHVVDIVIAKIVIIILLLFVLFYFHDLFFLLLSFLRKHFLL